MRVEDCRQECLATADLPLIYENLSVQDGIRTHGPQFGMKYLLSSLPPFGRVKSIKRGDRPLNRPGVEPKAQQLLALKYA